MVHICPKPCSRLATAAIFIIVGVVQLLVGVILLKSNYANLLSGPDFMAASSNIAVGCVYGITASMWKISLKRISVKNTARKNVLGALLLSVITINTTALVVLMLGNGNRLLSLHLEINKQETIDFAAEVMAYAYVTSLCSPIICIMVALIAVSGMCLEAFRNGKTIKEKNSISKDSPYTWIFDSKAQSGLPLSSNLIRTRSLTSVSSSSSKDSVFSGKNSSSSRTNSLLSAESIPSPLKMWKLKRERISNDISPHKQVLVDPLQKSDFHVYPYERLIPRIKRLASTKCSHMKSNVCSRSKSLCFKNCYASKYRSSVLKSYSNPDPNKMLLQRNQNLNNIERTLQYSKSGTYSDGIENRRYEVLDGTNKHCDTKMLKNRVLEHSEFKESVGANPKAIENTREQSLAKLKAYRMKNIHAVDPVVSELKSETMKELKKRVETGALIKMPDSTKSSQEMLTFKNSKEPVSFFQGIVGLKKNTPYCDALQLGVNEDSDGNNIPSYRPLPSDEQSLSDFQSDKILANINGFRSKTIKPGLNAISKTRSKSFDFPQNESEAEENQQNLRAVFSSKKMDEKPTKSSKKFAQATALKQKKWDASRKISSMTAISEMPLVEDIHNYSRRNAFRIYNCESNSKPTDENSNIENITFNKRIFSPKFLKKSSSSNRSLLKRIRSSGNSIPNLDISDLIADKDSLIGLSEEELWARTLRIRSLRHVVEERLKDKMEAEKQTNIKEFI